ncbi:MAG: monovalent cation/H(+) antiporter subunit G [Planctomycetota bacterium]|nr:monovalent cation/H(+) antiporter subunit G [Planctomycetota bacterium]
MLETAAYWVIGIGLAFDLFGCIGLVRLPDVYNRAQAATKCVTLGTCMILLGVVLLGFAGGNAPMGVKALLCAAFILLTSPVGAHAICRGAYISGVPLWSGSVEDTFVERAKTIRDEQPKEGPVQGEKA